jgi:hypothetical protein
MARVTGLAETQRALRRYGAAVERGAQEGLARGGREHTEPWERSHHPWQNRTRAAERNLHTWVTPSAHGYTLYNAHGVPYGTFLELHHDGRFAVLSQALRATWPQVLGTVVDAINARLR